MRNNPITIWAVKWITSRLRKDKDWYYSYQSNIAVCIQDEMAYWNYDVNKKTIHTFSNLCAKRFMDLWIRKEIRDRGSKREITNERE